MPVIVEEMTVNDGATSLALRRRLACRRIRPHRSLRRSDRGAGCKRAGARLSADRLVLGSRRRQILRYGENPHQEAALLRGRRRREVGVAGAEQLQGKALSYNNLNDTEAAFELVSEFQAPEFDVPPVAIIKHANPCGVALGDSLAEAYARAPWPAIRSAPSAASSPSTGRSTGRPRPRFRQALRRGGHRAGLFGPRPAPRWPEKKICGLLETGALADPGAPGMTYKSLSRRHPAANPGRRCRPPARNSRWLPSARPTSARWPTWICLLSGKCAKHVKSNAIVYVRAGATVGVGAGQMSRVDSARIAALKAHEAVAAAEQAGQDAGALGTQGSVVASDAFFPFADGLITAAEAGATAVIQPGGSVRDDDVIAAADEAGVAMVFTGMRHFRH